MGWMLNDPITPTYIVNATAWCQTHIRNLETRCHRRVIGARGSRGRRPARANATFAHTRHTSAVRYRRVRLLINLWAFYYYYFHTTSRARFENRYRVPFTRVRDTTILTIPSIKNRPWTRNPVVRCHPSTWRLDEEDVGRKTCRLLHGWRRETHSREQKQLCSPTDGERQRRRFRNAAVGDDRTA